MEPIFHPDAAAFRRWLERHHAAAQECYVGFYKKSSARRGITYQEAVDEALCFGWIDSVMKSLDAERYQHRFTPRKPGSIWSNVNVAHVARLTAAGRMHPAGLAAFAARDPRKTGVYSFETKTAPRLAPAETKRFRADAPAWKFFSAQPPGYRRNALHWVVAAKKPETRTRRFAQLLADSSAGRRLAHLA